eukprot:gene8278-11206_t
MVRIKNRFLTCQLLLNYPQGSDPSRNLTTAAQYISIRDIHDGIKEKIKELFGEIGLSGFGGNNFIRYFDQEYGSYIFIIRTSREYLNQMWLALSCVTKVNNQDIVIRSLAVNSCVRTCTIKIREILTTYFDNSSNVTTTANNKNAVLNRIIANIEF